MEAGFPNLARHLDNLKRWGVPAVIALNRFPGDTDADLQSVLAYCRSIGAEAALAEGYAKGGDGMTELAGKLVAAASAADTSTVTSTYRADQPLDAKITDGGHEGVRRGQGAASSRLPGSA